MTTEYITKLGDRWDLLAYNAYGTAANITLEDGSVVNAMSYLINSNPAIPIGSILEPGLLLQIPILSSTKPVTDEDLLPPWKK